MLSMIFDKLKFRAVGTDNSLTQNKTELSLDVFEEIVLYLNSNFLLLIFLNIQILALKKQLIIKV